MKVRARAVVAVRVLECDGLAVGSGGAGEGWVVGGGQDWGRWRLQGRGSAAGGCHAIFLICIFFGS